MLYMIIFVTDFGDDLAIAECKLSVMRIFKELDRLTPETVVVNDVLPFNKTHAAFCILRLASQAPKEAIFVCVIDPGVGTSRKGIIIKTRKDHYFIGPDNGIMYAAASNEGIDSVWRIREDLFPNASNTFHGRDIFSKVAGHISLGNHPSALGHPTNSIVKSKLYPGQIVHIDFYGNAKIFGRVPNHAKQVNLVEKAVKLPLVRTFEEVEDAKPLAYLGSSGLLEIAIRNRNATSHFGFKVGDVLKINFD